jgi:hypothetical protein
MREAAAEERLLIKLPILRRKGTSDHGDRALGVPPSHDDVGKATGLAGFSGRLPAVQDDCGTTDISSIHLQLPRTNQLVPARARNQLADRRQGKDRGHQVLAIRTDREGDLLLLLGHRKDCRLPDTARPLESPDHPMTVDEVHDAGDHVGLGCQNHCNVGGIGSRPGAEMRLRPRNAVEAGNGDGGVLRI